MPPQVSKSQSPRGTGRNTGVGLLGGGGAQLAWSWAILETRPYHFTLVRASGLTQKELPEATPDLRGHLPDLLIQSLRGHLLLPV